MHRRFAGLRVRLLVLVLLAVIPALGSLYLGARDIRRTTEAASQDEALELARLAAAQQDTAIEGMRQVLAAITQLAEVRALDPEACRLILPRLLNQYAGYSTFSLIDTRGDQVCSATPNAPVSNFADRPHFQAALARRSFALGSFTVGRASGKAILPATYPIFGPDGETRGVVITGLELSWLSQLVQRVDLPDGASVLLLDRLGTVLARYPEPDGWVGQLLPDAPVVRAMLAQHEGTAEVPGLDGTDRLFGFASLGGSEEAGYVAVGLPLNAAYAASSRAFAQAIMGLAVTALLVVLAAWCGGELFLLRPLRALHHAIARLRSGDLTPRTGSTARAGELAELAVAFDQMADTLQQRTAALERSEALAQAEEEQLARVLETITDALFLLDAEGRIVRANAAAARMVKQPLEAFVGRSLQSAPWTRYELDGSPSPRGHESFVRRMQSGEAARDIQYIYELMDGTRVVASINNAPLRDARGTVVGAVLLVRDITERTHLEAKLAYQATYDTLTDLPNRRTFMERLEQVTSRRAGEPVRGALLFLDLDGFKGVNDGLGHAAGDQLLKTVAQRLKSCVRPEDTVARFGGDEFLLLIEGVQTRADVERLAGRVLAHVSMPVDLDGRAVVVTGSAGITWVTAAAGAEGLLRQADMALYSMKGTGKNGFAWYAQEPRTTPPAPIDSVTMRESAEDTQPERLLPGQSPVAA